MGISQEKLAEAAHLSTQTINDIEGCRMWVSDKTIIKLAHALHVEVYQLLIPDTDRMKDFPSPTDVLVSLEKNIIANINLQFDEVLKIIR